MRPVAEKNRRAFASGRATGPWTTSPVSERPRVSPPDAGTAENPRVAKVGRWSQEDHRPSSDGNLAQGARWTSLLEEEPRAVWGEDRESASFRAANRQDLKLIERAQVESRRAFGSSRENELISAGRHGDPDSLKIRARQQSRLRKLETGHPRSRTRRFCLEHPGGGKRQDGRSRSGGHQLESRGSTSWLEACWCQLRTSQSLFELEPGVGDVVQPLMGVLFEAVAKDVAHPSRHVGR